MAGLLLAVLQLYQVATHFLGPGTGLAIPGLASAVENVVRDAPAVVPVVVGYLLLLVASHVALMSLLAWLHREVVTALAPNHLDRIGPLLVSLVMGAVLAALWNRRLFPSSLAFPDSDLLLLQSGGPALFWGLTAVVALALGLALLRLLRRRPRWALIAGGLAGILVLVSAVGTGSVAPRHSGVDAPDVIIIGVDSLRPDMLGRVGLPGESLTPTLDQLVTDAVLFDDTLTPLARTFGAYMTVLSGQYPPRNGVRENLYPKALFERSDLLPQRFRQAGYATFYATDESRFANIDEDFGFDFAVAPPAGVLDFLLGSAYDSVATNLLGLTGLTRWITPHVYGNRAAYRTYKPEHHVRRVLGRLGQVPASKPLFLVSHYCLPHWPYLAGAALGHEPPLSAAPLGPRYRDHPDAYLRALKSVDLQVGRLVVALKQAGRLDNAILVVLSDHGEAFGLPKDRMTSMDPPGELPSYQGFGHGNFALDGAQNRVVLAFQRFRNGQAVWDARVSDVPSVLVDIAPTLLDASDIKGAGEDFDGVSLLPTILGDDGAVGERLRFVESGISAATVDTEHVDERAVALEFMDFYGLANGQRLELRVEHVPALLARKQRVVYGSGYALASMPMAGGEGSRGGCWVLADLRAGTMRCISSPEEDPSARPLFHAGCRHFARDVDFVKRWCGSGQD